MALYENVSAPLTVCFRAVSTPRGIRIKRHLAVDFQSKKRALKPSQILSTIESIPIRIRRQTSRHLKSVPIKVNIMLLYTISLVYLIFVPGVCTGRYAGRIYRPHRRWTCTCTTITTRTIIQSRLLKTLPHLWSHDTPRTSRSTTPRCLTIGIGIGRARPMTIVRPMTLVRPMTMYSIYDLDPRVKSCCPDQSERV